MQPGQVDAGVVDGDLPFVKSEGDRRSPVKARGGSRRFIGARWNGRETTDVSGSQRQTRDSFPYVKTGTHPDVSGWTCRSLEVRSDAR